MLYAEWNKPEIHTLLPLLFALKMNGYNQYSDYNYLKTPVGINFHTKTTMDILLSKSNGRTII